MTRHTFTRRDGSRFELVLTVDDAKLAEDMARSMTRHGRTTAKKCSGAIVATIKEIPA